MPVISHRSHPDIHGLGKLRYVVEQTSVLLYQFKRLAVLETLMTSGGGTPLHSQPTSA
ncbi:hypothetical protein [Streptacidiphilus sp. P02-A3a]|uniref:hypothetical protein n=1 Tax=Streptacidiphilus sp. P02-A3a TaxID=2704468 RepID=UPI0015FBB56A|nr:hypothetical protein [Streptacidiphilus sp. P02-A3a]QMU68693.1 hypothetical protein GXP74_11070 [Streptacidiphilus sp. P02-A3a]